MLFWKYTDRAVVDGQPMRLSFVGVKKACFNGIPRRNVLMEFPRELGLPPDKLGLQVRCAYGTRDAGAIWEDTHREDFGTLRIQVRHGFTLHFLASRQAAHLCCARDDFTTLGSDDNLNRLETMMAESF